jgi:2-oxoglutarate ferredoxin oxidoreductase subunit delta
MSETRAARAGGRGVQAPPGPDVYDEGQLADLPWIPSHTFTSGGAVLFLHEAWCKGCGICVEVCPQGTLKLDGRDKPVVLPGMDCTGCLRCELLCPDFALLVIEPPRRARGAA